MKKTLALLAVVLAIGLTSFDAEARRLGGGKSSGMQRERATAPAGPAGNRTAPSQAQQAPAPAGAPAAATAAQPKRSWMGPIAGLAAGLGLAALASHLGFGEGLANMLMIGLLVMAALAVLGFVMRKRAGQAPAMAGGAPQAPGMFRTGVDSPPAPAGRAGSRLGAGIGSALAGGAQPASTVPADFDVAGFLPHARENFLRLQAANDARDLTKLRDYLSPEMFEAVRAEIASRDDTPQATEVFGLDAQVLEVADENGQYVVSVRFSGSIRDQQGAVPEDLNEVWHLTKPRQGAGGWVVAGIQQV